MASTHATRFRRWQNLCPPATRYLVTAADERLVPILEARGFLRVDMLGGDPELTVSGSEIALERVTGDFRDLVTISFWKYRAPKLQVHFDRRMAAEPRSFIRSGNLVPRPSKYYYIWGKPWWMPTRFWSTRASDRTVSELARRLPEVLAFLESGERGASISKFVEVSPLKDST